MDTRRLSRCGVASLLALTLATLASGCAMEDVLPAPNCVTGETLILTAQSVPTAELVPCFDAFPAGWDATSVTIDQDGTVVRFDSDRAGERAATFRFARTCEPGRAVRAPSEYDGTERYELIERVAPSLRAQRFYVFTGGCVWWDFDFAAEATSALAIELGDSLALVSRDDLNESIRETFIDEEV